ncbi:hypothetical protein BDV96DRAFT_584108 [Lophiotrema nucula]|uniref:Uncharacterized protein n=1 Tax=Lophiotrema nucula TaxID=690887 RepID=A0A6A5YUS8_9PLEO|nr:hypothetical protein BDV96DRAFT_584108 [Lophiotrema nucula]
MRFKRVIPRPCVLLGLVLAVLERFPRWVRITPQDYTIGRRRLCPALAPFALRIIPNFNAHLHERTSIRREPRKLFLADRTTWPLILDI